MSRNTGVLLPSLSNKETSRELQVHLKPKKAKHRSKIQKVSDGQHPLSIEPTTRQLLSDIIGSKRCVFACADSSGITTVPEICGGVRRRESENNILEESDGLIGHNNLIFPCNTVGSTPLQKSPELDPIKVGQASLLPGQESDDSLECQAVTTVVDGATTSVNRESLGVSNPVHHNNGCELLGMGSASGLSDSSGTMVKPDQQQVFEQQRAASSLGSHTGIQNTYMENPRDDTYRQQYSGGIHKSPGRHKKQVTATAGVKDSALGRTQSQVYKSGSPEGDTKLPSRLPEQMQSVPGRMESQRPGVSSVDRTLDCSSSGFIRQKEQCEMPDVLLSLSPRRTMGSRCLLDQLEPSQNVHFSASTFDFQSTEQNLSRPGGSNLDCPVLAKKTVVCSATTISYGSSDPSRSRGPVNSGTSGASQSEPSSSFSMEPEWRILKSKGFSNRLSETLLQSRKKVTRQIYSKAWRVYNNWCEANSRDTGHSNSVLEFLQDGFQKGLSSSTLKVQVSALTVFLDRKLAEEEDIIRFFKALRRIRPTIHSRVPSWDLNTVLQGLCEPPFEPLVDSSDKLLTIKTAFLLAITSARRVGELQALSILEPYCVISDDRITLRLDTSFLPKVVSKFHRSQEIFLPSFCNNPSNQKEQKLHCLDVRRCVLEYLQRTKSWRTSNALLVLFAGKFRGKQASKSTIARWIKQAISLSYAQQGKQLTSAVRAHSTRAVSTSWAERAGASVEQICKAATWSSQNTFVRHYRLDVLSSADLTFGRKVLQAVIPP
ncbi:uncharacterized protein [Hyperolius riggenbachi]|uniref:uncharacterized protein n=1 Tax=Hyperolius riggenbachi TaxID=752182 RepID=UPI0035A31825